MRFGLPFVLLAALAACKGGNDAAPAASGSAVPSAAANVSGFTKVEDPTKVCMVNDMFMGRPQIPIEVDGQTYYGCCENCKAKLGNDATARTAKDPVTGEPVDKARAVIAQDSTGKVLYFASDETWSKFAAQPTN